METRGTGISEFENSLFYTESSRIVRNTQKNPVSKTKKSLDKSTGEFIITLGLK